MHAELVLGQGIRVGHQAVERLMRLAGLQGVAAEDDLKQRALTNLYNQRPSWFDLAHERLDDAVLDAHGWPHGLTDEPSLEMRLAEPGAGGRVTSAPVRGDAGRYRPGSP